MRRLLIRLLLAVVAWSLAAPEVVRAQGAKAPSALVIPHYDPPDQPFRMAPMPQSTRSIVVPLATNLHLAFDTALLRTHTVWSGRGLALLGPQYGLPKSPFISTNDGTVLWTMPPVFPWWVGKLPSKDDFKAPLDLRFEALGDEGLVYSGKQFRFYERFSGLKSPALGTVRHIAANPTNSVGKSLSKNIYFLAHAELGNGYLLSETPPVALIERTNDALLITLEDNSGKSRKPASLKVLERKVDYSAEMVTEAGAEKGNSKFLTTGKQARVYVAVPSGGEVNFNVITEVVANKEAATKASAARQKTLDELSEKFLVFPPTNSAGPVLKASPTAKPSLAGNASYRSEAFPLPPSANLLITGMAFVGSHVSPSRAKHLAVCTWPGEIWCIENATGPVTAATYRRMAAGFCEPMGLLSYGVTGMIVATKPGLYRLDAYDWDSKQESSQDGIYEYNCLSQAWGYTGSYNAFVYGPVYDRKHNLVVASAGHSGRWDSAYMGWALNISQDGKRVEPICSGLREPNGIGTFGPDRDVFVTENQGQWMAACKLNHVAPGKFYGHPSAWPAPQEEYGKHTRFDPPAVWFPYKLARSVTGFAEITDDRFGPFKGQLMVGDFQNAIVTRVQLEKVNGEYQGAVWPFLKKFQSGVNRLVYGPDGKLYVGGLQAPRSWMAVAPLNASLERIEFTGKLPFEVQEVHAQRDGFELTFTQPVEAKAAADPESYDVTQYGYKYHAKYGSPELDHDGKENAATGIKVGGAIVSPDKLKVRLQLSGWKPGYVTMVRSLDVKNATGEALVNDTFWYTLNQIPK